MSHKRKLAGIRFSLRTLLVTGCLLGLFFGFTIPKAYEMVTAYLQTNEIIPGLDMRIPPSSAKEIITR
jgi:hypothetical protein